MPAGRRQHRSHIATQQKGQHKADHEKNVGKVPYLCPYMLGGGRHSVSLIAGKGDAGWSHEGSMNIVAIHNSMNTWLFVEYLVF